MAFSNDQPMVSNQLAISIDFPPEFDPFLTVITDTYKKIANVVNTKEGALYNPNEVATFKLLAGPTTSTPPRNVYRKVIDLVNLNGAPIGASATVNFPHGIIGITNTMLIYASCTSSTSIFFTVVHPDVFVDATTVTFTNPLAVTLTQAIAIIEIVKSL